MRPPRFLALLRHCCGSAMLFAFVAIVAAGSAQADVPGRAVPGGAVPNPGTQQQELTNITFPGEFNVFEFVVTCAGCHGGSIDQHTGHFGNWAGSSMASAARDPIFRANQIGVNNTIKAVTGQDGAGNVCFRCHSPNGWLSGRFDPSMGGSADGSQLIQSILLSTDNEGITCETCHRAVGAVTYKRADLGLLEKVWNFLAGLFDWEHSGREAKDQAGTPLIGTGLPYGDTALQFQDGVAYVGKYSGTGDLYFSDLPIGGNYTGQIYAVYPDWWISSGNPIVAAPAGSPTMNSAGQTLAYAPDGTLPPIFEVPVGLPTSITTGQPNYALQGLSLEHPTVGSAGRQGSQLTANTATPALPPGMAGQASPNEFIRTSEFCGSCHDLTVPVLNHGMPEQRTYSEWKYSSYSQANNAIADPLGKRIGSGVERCQDCHMPTLRHEYNDLNSDTVNADPALAGTFPYAKNRAAQGGTAMHKLTGANRDLPEMMKALYPEIDLEVVGAPTGKDPRGFPGMLSDRGPMWDRAKQNTEVTLRDGVDVKIVNAPTEVIGAPGVYEFKVRVINKSGHRIPSGYPDGRRFWLSVQAKDSSGTPVYVSGVYDPVAAELKTTNTVAFKRSQGNVIDATNPLNNAVQVYERVTGTCSGSAGAIFPDPTAGTPVACTPSPSLLNNFILFDNRIPPKGLNYTAAREAGVKFWNYGANYVPSEDSNRYSAVQLAGGYDEVTYRFSAAPNQLLSASAEIYWQTHTRDFIEHLRTQDTSTVRPERSPNPFDPNYPNNPNYISDSIAGLPLSSYSALDGTRLEDNWGGVAYAAWLATGKGAPFLVDRDDTSVTQPPAAPIVTARALNSSDPDYIDPITQAPNAFAARIVWTPVANADGYTIWIRYGKTEATSDWDRLAVVGKDVSSFTEHVLGDAAPASPGKTYGFKVVAFNGKGEAASAPVNHTVASALPAAPSNVVASKVTPESTNAQVTLSWTDNATNEVGFDIWRIGPMSRAGVPVIWNGQPPAAFVGGVQGGNIPTATGGPAGGAPVTGTNTFIDASLALEPEACYDYQVRSVNANLDVSAWSQITTSSRGCTVATNSAINLSATAASGTVVNLSWTTNVSNTVTNFVVKRNGTVIATVTKSTATQYSYSDATAQPATTYTYTVEATGSNPLVVGSATATTPAVPKAPTALNTLPTTSQITVSWTDNANNEDGFVLERSDNGGAYAPIPGKGAFLPPNTTSYVDTVAAGGLLPNVTYQYRVKAIHLVNGDSGYAVSSSVQLISPPAAPTNLSALAASGSVSLKWLDNAANEQSFQLQRASNNACSNWGNSFTVPAVVGSGSTGSLTLNDVSPNSVRPQSGNNCYRIRAVNGAGNSAWSNTAQVNVVPAPSNPSAPNVSNSGICNNVNSGNCTQTVSGNISNTTPAITGWVLQRCQGTTTSARTGNNQQCGPNGAGWAQISSGSASGSYNVTSSGLVDNTYYSYRINRTNAGGTSSWSNVQSRQR